MSRTRRCRWASPSSRNPASRRCFSTRENCRTRCGRGSPTSPRSRSPDRLTALLESSGAAGSKIAFDAATAPAMLTQTLRRAGGEPAIAAGPDRADEGVQEQDRARGRPRGACARRRGRHPVSALVRARGGEGRRHRDFRGAGARDLSPRGGRARGHFVSDDSGGRAARGDPALPRQRGIEPPRRQGPVPDRQRRSIRRRHDRHHPDGRGGQTQPGNARSLHPGAEGPYRDRPRGFPQGTTGAQIDAFARRALWQAGLDFDHGTGHGIGSYSPSTKARSGSPRRARPRWLRA